MIEIKNGVLHLDRKPVQQVPTKNRGGAIVPRFIVVHDTASGLKDDGDIAWLAGQSPNSSAHFVVNRAGCITQLAPCNVKTWHAGQSKWAGLSMLNGYSIGIEIDNPGRLAKVRDGVYSGICTIDTSLDPSLRVGYAESPAHGKGYWLAYTDTQIATVTEMCRAMASAYPIEDIVTHWMIAPGRKVDTNPLFPLEAVRDRVFGQADAKPATPSAPAVVPDATVTASALNLRGAPGGRIVGSLKRGTRLDVQDADRIEGWLRVVVVDGPARGKTGFVSQHFVRLD